jgi:hypothetical protein
MLLTTSLPTVHRLKKSYYLGSPTNHEAVMPERRNSKPKLAGKTFAVVLVKVVKNNQSDLHLASQYLVFFYFANI